MKKKGGFLYVKIDSQHHHFVMDHFGYVRHKFESWVKDITAWKRFHVYARGDSLEIHMDTTVNGLHRVMPTNQVLQGERGRIRRFCKKIASCARD